MKSFSFIKTLLSSRLITIIIILLSIAGRVIQKIGFADANGDKAYQIQATKNLLQGHGISIYETTAANLSQSHYIPLIKWPPGYSLFMSPFYSINSGGQAIWGSLWLDILCAVLFVWMGRKIMLLLKTPIYLVNVYSLITGFFLYAFCSSNSSDLTTIVLYQVAIYLTLKLIGSDEKKYALALLTVFFLFLCGLMRYMFIPVVFVIPGYFVLKGFISKNKALLRMGVFMMLSLTALTAGLLIFQKIYGGAAAYMMETQKGFYPQYFFRMNPFLFSSFINKEVTIVQLEKLTGSEYGSIEKYFQLTNFAILAVLLSAFFFWIKKIRLPSNLTENYIYIGVFSSIAVIALLSYLSISHALIPIHPDGTWSFIDEERYFSIPIFFSQQFLFLIACHYYDKIKKVGQRLLVTVMAIQLLMLVHIIYFTSGLLIKLSKRTELNTMDYAKQLLHKVVDENGGKHIVSAASDPMFNNFTYMWEGVPGLYDLDKLNSLQLKTDKETIVFVSVQKRDEYVISNFMNSPYKQLIGEMNDFRFYLIHVNPD